MYVGEIKPGMRFKCEDGTVSVVLSFDPRESTDVAFRDEEDGSSYSWMESTFRRRHPDPPLSNTPEVPSALPSMLPPGATIVRVDYTEPGGTQVFTWIRGVL